MTRARSDKTPGPAQTGVEPARRTTQPPRWTPATRLAFRFAFVYLGLFCLVTQISGSMLANLSVYYRGLGRLWPFRDVTFWTASRVFGVTLAPAEATTSGEPIFFWGEPVGCWQCISAPRQ
jgi:hypothetical protein